MLFASMGFDPKQKFLGIHQRLLAYAKRMVNNTHMKFKDWVKKKHGRNVLLARALGVTPPVVSDWVNGKKGVPLERCVQIEVATEGAVNRQALRPDDWHLIWPELAAKVGADFESRGA